MFAYVPADAPGGMGHAVVTDRFVCLLGEESDAGVAVELYRLLELPATTIADVLDVFAMHGVATRFALVQVLDPGERVVQVAVAGEVAVDLTGATSTRLSGPTGATSFTGEVRGVQTLRLALGAHDDGSTPLPIRRGVVRTRAIAIDAATDSAPAFPAEPSTRPLVLQLPDGSELEPSTPVVLGRRPWRTSPDETTTFYVIAPSPRREISGIHLEVAVVDGQLVARDLESTNGTLILTPAHAPRLLHEGRSTALRAGDILDLGEDFRIAVGTRNR